jgi:Xaa-Pro aminopeptidase
MAKKLTAPLLIIGSSGDPSDLRYGCGFTPVDPVVFLDEGRARHLVVPLLEIGRARHESPRVKVISPADLGIPRARRRRLGEWALAVLRSRHIRRVRVGPYFPAAVLRRLERAGIRVLLTDEPVYPQRVCKSAEEIARISEVQRAAVAAVRAAIAELRRARVDRAGYLVRGGKRLTSEDVRLVVEFELLRHQCQARDTIVAGGRQAADPHDRGSGPLRAGETIVLDIFPQHKRHGYWGDITRTVVKGRARPELHRMYEAVRAAQAAALREVRAGARADCIHEGVQQKFAAAGFVTGMQDGLPVGFFHGTGHGVGLDIHEAPSLSTVPVRLRAGHVVTVEPGLYYPELGGVRLEDTVAVTGSGCRILAACEKVFEI